MLFRSANALKALLVIPVIIVFGGGEADLVLGLLVLFVLGVGRFILAALSASTPHVVRRPELITANAFAPTSGTIATGIGAVAGVALRGLLGGGDSGSQLVLVASIVSFVLAGLVASRLSAEALGPDNKIPTDSVRQVWQGLVLGAKALSASQPARKIMLGVVANRLAFGVLIAGGLLLVRGSLNAPTEADAALADFALATGGAALGALVGAIITPALTRTVGIFVWASVVIAQAGLVGFVLLAATSLQPSLLGLVAGAVSIGLTGQSVKVCADTVLQREIPDAKLGRVFSLFDMIVNVCLVVGITITAFVSPATGRFTFGYLACGVLLVLTALWFKRSYRRSGQEKGSTPML